MSDTTDCAKGILYTSVPRSNCKTSMSSNSVYVDGVAYIPITDIPPYSFYREEQWRKTIMSLKVSDNIPGIKKVIYNPPATIIFWEDGTKTVVKCQDDDVYDKERGFMMALMKKLYGGPRFNDVLRKWVWEDKTEIRMTDDEYNE